MTARSASQYFHFTVSPSSTPTPHQPRPLPLHSVFGKVLQIRGTLDTGDAAVALSDHIVTMPSRRKRNAGTEELCGKSKKSKNACSANTLNKKLITPAPFSAKHCEKWFCQYAKSGASVIEPDGVERLCFDLGVQPENIVCLVLAWKLNAERMGYFSQDEWRKGMSDLECDSIDKLRMKLPQLLLLLEDAKCFKAIYRYAFDFTRERDQRSLDIDSAKVMISLLLDKWLLLPDFFLFLDQSKYKVINKDQWNNILEFSRTVHPGLHNYDEDGAWPVLLDEFVEWQRNEMADGSSCANRLECIDLT